MTSRPLFACLAAVAVATGVGCSGDVLLADSCASVDCGLHGSCVADFSGATCECQSGYAVSGLSCAPIDPCETADCGAHGRCAAGACECDSGFEPSGLSCVAIPACRGVDCGAHGRCEASSGAAACQCDTGFEASGVSCVPIDPCKGVDCGAHGRCAVAAAAASCQCDSGFEPSGLSCIAIDPCKAVTCGTGAHCAAGVCACDAGLSGNPAVECTAPTSHELAVRAKLVAIAQAEVGKCEGVEQRPYMEQQPGLWCYDFVAWVYAESGEGLGTPLSLPQREPQSLPNWRPKAGDLIKYPYQHYAMVKEVVGDTVYTIEGNVNACVMERSTSYADVEYYGTLETSF